MSNEENRPNPDELLKAIQLEEESTKKGHLKIFLGMAAGVGKTYAMLEEAKALTLSGVDVRIGTVDTHNRKETMALLSDIKEIPEKIVLYKDHEFKELDLEEVIKQKPFIVLVDELAHSNVPGLRHEKRWQDVIEILNNGINVYTTLNVQHIESLKDIIENITGIIIKETVPDMIIDLANAIRIVDITPIELLKRLSDGKVYLGNQSKMAVDNFFKANRLSALREILLRYSAEKIDYDLHQMVSMNESESRWKPREKLLIAVSPSPHSQKLIRATRRLAFNLEAPWIAVYVDTGKPLDNIDEERLSKNLSLARDLGAEVITTKDPDVANAIQRIAKKRAVTQIIVGRSPPKKFFDFFRKPTLLDILAKECTDVDIHVIRQENLLTATKKRLRAFGKPSSYKSYFLVTLSAFVFIFLNWLAFPFIDHNHRIVAELFFLAILAICLFFKKGPTLFATILFGAVWYLIFTPDEVKTATESILVLVIYFLTAISTGILIDRYRNHQEMLAKREETSMSLYRIIRQIAGAPSIENMINEVALRLGILFDSSFEILIKDINNGLKIASSSLLKNDKEKAGALYVFEQGEEAGWTTDTLPSSEYLYIPIKGFQSPVGVLVFKKNLRKTLSLDEKNFLYTICQQLSHRIERVFAQEYNRQNELRLEIDKINKSVLKQITKKLQPSLSETKDALYVFKNRLSQIKDPSLNEEFLVIEQNFNQLTRHVENLFMMTNRNLLKEDLEPK